VQRAALADIEVLLEKMLDFHSSNFKREYERIPNPQCHQHGALLNAVEKVVEGYGRSHGISDAEGAAFSQSLYSEWELATDTVQTAAGRVWTSTEQSEDGREFCSIFNQTIREDHADLAPHTALISRAINLNLTEARGGGNTDFPPLGVSWRGGGFMDTPETRAFFVPGRKYRVPNYLATSFDKGVTTAFLGRVKFSGPVNALVLWKVQVNKDGKTDNNFKCRHVNLVKAKTRSLQQYEQQTRSEKEYLFAAFSPFTVTKVTWSQNSQSTPHLIEITAALDGTQEPEDLPLALWS
jgi:hypothetical protein